MLTQLIHLLCYMVDCYRQNNLLVTFLLQECTSLAIHLMNLIIE